MQKSRCQGCGAEIIWIKTASGKSMPCDPQKVPYWERPGSPKKVIVPQSGTAVSCELDGPKGEVTGFGYISHFSTCPQAGRFRGRK